MIYLLNVYPRPRHIQQKVIHGTMMNVKKLLKRGKKALNKFKKYPTKDNLNEVKVFRANARRTIKISKRKSWRSYVSKINHKTPIKKVWDMIRKNIW